MADEVLYALGVDINSSGEFINGDIALASYDDNLRQAIVNRLNTELNELDWFYYDYGSILTGFLGWKATDTTLGFIKSEITKVLSEEVRLTGFSVNVEYTGDGKVRIDLQLHPSTATIIPMSLVLTTTGVVEIETDEINIGEEE